MTALGYEAWTTEDGFLWGVFVYGHHDLDVVKSEAVTEMLISCIMTATMLEIDEARELIASSEPGHHWMYNAFEDEEAGSPEAPWRFCGATIPGAVAITGWRFV